MPAGGDLGQYKGRRDWGSRGDAQRAMYDLCRDSHMSHDQAALHSEIGAARLARDMGDGKGPELAVRLASTEPTEERPRHVGRSVFKTPWFGPFAGRRCRVLEDGTLEPVDG